MRRFLVVLLASLAMSSCVSLQAAHLRGLCIASNDTRPWTLLSAPPANAEVYRSMLRNAAPYYRPPPGEFWYSLPTGDIKLCHTDRRTPSCVGSYTDFTPSENGPVMGDTQEWICVS